MTKPAPIVDLIGRLGILLHEYERDEVWLQVKEYYSFSSQDPQVVVAIEDANGSELRNSSGRARTHTFRLDPNLPTIAVGQRFHLARDDSGLRVTCVQVSSGDWKPHDRGALADKARSSRDDQLLTIEQTTPDAVRHVRLPDSNLVPPFEPTPRKTSMSHVRAGHAAPNCDRQSSPSPDH